MSNSFIRMLKLAEALYSSNDMNGLSRLCAQSEAYMKKCAHYEAVNDGTTPNPWRLNMDYSGWENSPYFGSISEFMEKFPGGIGDWVKWRKETEKERNLLWSKISERRSQAKIAVADDTLITVKKWSAILKEKARSIAAKYIEDSVKESSGLKQLKWESVRRNMQNYLEMLDQNIDAEMKKNNFEAIIRSLLKFKNTPKYKKYKMLFFNLAEYIVNTAADDFYRYLGTVEAPRMAADDEGFIPTKEEVELSNLEPTEEERIKARQLMEKVLELITKEEAELLLEESSPKKVIEAHYVPVGPDDTKKFPNEPHIYSDEGLNKFKSITEYLKKYRGQEANDLGGAALKAVFQCQENGTNRLPFAEKNSKGIDVSIGCSPRKAQRGLAHQAQ